MGLSTRSWPPVTPSGIKRSKDFLPGVPHGRFRRNGPANENYVKKRSAFIDRGLLNDSSVPVPPQLSYTGASGYPANAIKFKTSPFESTEKFAAIQWRLGETALMTKNGRPTAPGKYEITPVWESGELTTFADEITVPSSAIKPGHTYRARARMKGSTGRWSHWSAPVQFVATTGK